MSAHRPLPRAARERRLAALLAGVLALSLLVIAGVLWQERRARPLALLPDARGVSRIEIERSGRATIELARENGDWRVVAPCALAANTARIEPLLEALAIDGPGYAASEVDLPAAGLDAPAATLRLDGRELSLGATDLSGQRRYLRRGERVALIPEWVLPLLDGGLSALADPVLFDLPPRALRRVEPAPGALDVAPWTALTASQIVAWPLADAPRAARRARLVATLEDGTERRLDVETNPDWSAIRVDGGGCALLVAADALPPDTHP